MTAIRTTFLLAAACLLIAGPSTALYSRSASVRQGTTPSVVPSKPSATYDLGEKVSWTVSLPAGADGAGYSYRIKRNNQEQIQQAPLDLSSGKATIEIAGDRPAMLYGEILHEGKRPVSFAAAVAPRDLKPVVPKPRDFDRFWKAKVAALGAIPANPVLTPQDSGRPDVRYATIKMDHLNGTHVYGQMAWPTKPGKHPAVLVLQWASPPYPLDRSWVMGYAAQGWIALDIEPHDVLPTEARAYYVALPNAIKHYESIGQDDRDKSYFVEMYLRDYRAADYLSQLPDWDGKTLVVTGGSMGGQQSLCVAGLHPKITHLIVEEPAGCDLNAGLHGRQEGYPFFSPADPKTMAVAPYVDCVNFAPHIRATSLVAMGYRDNVAPPAGIWTAFNLIRGRKEAAPMPEAPHNNLATAEQQRPYFTRQAAWLTALISGQKIPPP